MVIDCNTLGFSEETGTGSGESGLGAKKSLICVVVKTVTSDHVETSL